MVACSCVLGYTLQIQPGEIRSADKSWLTPNIWAPGRRWASAGPHRCGPNNALWIEHDLTTLFSSAHKWSQKWGWSRSVWLSTLFSCMVEKAFSTVASCLLGSTPVYAGTLVWPHSFHQHKLSQTAVLGTGTAKLIASKPKHTLRPPLQVIPPNSALLRHGNNSNVWEQTCLRNSSGIGARRHQALAVTIGAPKDLQNPRAPHHLPRRHKKFPTAQFEEGKREDFWCSLILDHICINIGIKMYMYICIYNCVSI